MKNAAMWQLYIANHKNDTYEDFEQSESHTPNNVKPSDVDDRLWMKAFVNTPPRSE